MYTLAVLISGSGSNLQALFDAEDAGTLGGATVGLVLSDRADAYGLQRALKRKVAAAHVPLPAAPKGPERAAARAAWEQRMATIISAFTPDLVLLSGFMRILSPTFLEQFPGRIINQHPALLPADGSDTVTTSGGIVIPALRGAHVVPDALRHGLPVTGCTIHRATPRVDDGPILAQAEVTILPSDTEQSLHERIKAEECRLIVEVVRALANSSE